MELNAMLVFLWKFALANAQQLTVSQLVASAAHANQQTSSSSNDRSFASKMAVMWQKQWNWCPLSVVAADPGIVGSTLKQKNIGKMAHKLQVCNLNLT